MNSMLRGIATTAGPSRVEVLSRPQLGDCARWARAFSGECKDARYYELVEDTIHPEFDYRYFVIRDRTGGVSAIQPFFLLDQDLLAGTSPTVRHAVDFARRIWPHFLKLRTLMVGCVAGKAHLDAAGEGALQLAQDLAAGIMAHARVLKARLVVLKEFPESDRQALGCFVDQGFTRVPSMPMVALSIAYPTFEDYMMRALGSRTRAHMRRNFRDAARGAPVELTVVVDISPFIEEVFPLYENVYARSTLHFEKLTKEYFCNLSQRMPDKSRFFIWRRSGKIVAFTYCMIQDDEFFSEYIGLDYSVALELHLYYIAFRDMVSWAMSHGFKWYRSSGLNYEPKYHLGCKLDPIDLYIRHTSSTFNALLIRVLPLLEPVRYDKTLKKFSNYDELWGRSP